MFFLSIRVSFWLAGAGRMPRRCAATEGVSKKNRRATAVDEKLKLKKNWKNQAIMDNNLKKLDFTLKFLNKTT